MSKCYFGWAKDESIRERGANGGFVTATLVGALETGLICLLYTSPSPRD